jgi:hypothetical protein
MYFGSWFQTFKASWWERLVEQSSSHHGDEKGERDKENERENMLTLADFLLFTLLFHLAPNL